MIYISYKTSGFLIKIANDTCLVLYFLVMCTSINNDDDDDDDDVDDYNNNLDNIHKFCVP